MTDQENRITDAGNAALPSEHAERRSQRPDWPTLPPPDPSLMDTLTEGVDADSPVRIEEEGHR